MRALNIDDFKKKSFKTGILEEACSDLRDKRAGLFAYLYYDNMHNNLNKLLDDNRFYAMLNEVSGRELSIFFIDNREVSDSSNQIKMRQMNREFLESLSLRIEIDEYAPYLILFQINTKGEVINSFINIIPGRTKEEVELNLKENIKEIVNVLKNTPYNVDRIGAKLLNEVISKLKRKEGMNGIQSLGHCLFQMVGFVNTVRGFLQF